MIGKILTIAYFLYFNEVLCLPTNRLQMNAIDLHRNHRTNPPHQLSKQIQRYNDVLRGGGWSPNKSNIKTPVRIQELPASDLRGYVENLLVDQLRAVLPMCIFLAGCQLIILRQPISGSGSILLGITLVVLGLALFNFGLLYGLIPTGKEIGLKLPSILPLSQLLAVAGILGVAVTLAEPALGVVKTAGSHIKEDQAPYLYALLHKQQVRPAHANKAPARPAAQVRWRHASQRTRRSGRLLPQMPPPHPNPRRRRRRGRWCSPSQRVWASPPRWACSGSAAGAARTPPPPRLPPP